ncbi:hypothetical protein JS528_05975 [Bifidobacterium sp. MA2]|uniref:DUF4190 domain-containing protein n=1 Tax=Bifidobacterium santillanense TaxID=2809028 RepID=A0ABS5UPN1_9BIFI|nr:hypothetical protein [Bifidobacterium santillanense]
MRSQFGPNYNPYLYGAPDPDPKTTANGGQPQAGAPQGTPVNPANSYGGYNQYNPGGYPGMQGQPYGQPGANPNAGPYNPYAQSNQPYGNGTNANRPDGHVPRYIYGIDVNDPNQNPLYGRWDSYAIISFVFALIFSVPVLPAIMGAASLWRTSVFHMKGKGLAIAAIVINVITTGVQIWMWLNGMSVSDLYTDLLNMYGMGGGSGSSSGDSMSA